MMRLIGFLLLIVLLLPFHPAHADTNIAPYNQPDLVSFGAGFFDFDKFDGRKRSADMRLEYRWGLSMLPLISPYFKSWDEYVQFHPYAGVETTSRGAFYGSGGWAMDSYIGRHGIFTWMEGVGYYEPGNMNSLSSVIEFRSQFEGGYRFDDDMRITAAISHISNAGMTRHNPGAEIAGVYLHVPVNMFCAQ